MIRPEEFREILLSRRIATPETLTGCTESEIADIEQANGVRLPEAYKQFLRIAGVQAGEFMDGITAFYPEVRDLTAETREHLKGIVELPPQAFVFASHLGEAFTYFIADGVDDPIIYGWTEVDETRTALFYRTFWECIEEGLKPLLIVVGKGGRFRSS